jgi:hypothetical protein
MHIVMTVHAGCFRFREHKAFMALPAINDLMLPRKGHRGFIMIESIDRLIKLPAISTMTKITAELKIFAVR